MNPSGKIFFSNGFLSQRILPNFRQCFKTIGTRQTCSNRYFNHGWQAFAFSILYRFSHIFIILDSHPICPKSMCHFASLKSSHLAPIYKNEVNISKLLNVVLNYLLILPNGRISVPLIPVTSSPKICLILSAFIWSFWTISGYIAATLFNSFSSWIKS